MDDDYLGNYLSFFLNIFFGEGGGVSYIEIQIKKYTVKLNHSDVLEFNEFTSISNS